jgi:hypothetical protein
MLSYACRILWTQKPSCRYSYFSNLVVQIIVGQIFMLQILGEQFYLAKLEYALPNLFTSPSLIFSHMHLLVNKQNPLHKFKFQYSCIHLLIQPHFHQILWTHSNHHIDHSSTLCSLWSKLYCSTVHFCPLVFGGRRERSSCISLLTLWRFLVASHHPSHPMALRVSGPYTPPIPHLQAALASPEPSSLSPCPRTPWHGHWL